MSHRLRVLLALAGLLGLTVTATWLLATRLALFPLLEAMGRDRVETALFLAEAVESSPDPAGEAWDLALQLGVEVQPVPERPDTGPAYRVLQRRQHELWISRRPTQPLYVATHGLPVWGMALRWPVDIERPRRQVGIGFPLIALAVLAGAAAASGWVLRPLRQTSAAMERVARGDLSVRVPEGHDEAGRIGATFNRMAEQVAAMLRGQRRLVAGVSHELRTPLARMRLLTELMRDDGGDEQRLDALDAEIGAVDGLVGELLEAARLEEGTLALRREPLLVTELTEAALAAVDLGEREVAVQIPAGLAVDGDRVRLVRVLSNLLSNTVRYTPHTAHVSISAAVVGDRACITVSDDGPGVPPEDLPQLFEPFFRSEQSRSRATGGLGLGLMLVKQIVEAHGGAVRAENRPAGGLAVSLEIPLATSHTTEA
ncbi:MAG: HAMP domain-containing sensor histidine kinase [Pseudomonadota bacterium]